MSTLLIDDTEARAREQELLITQTDFSALAPGTFEGIPGALGQGISRAAATVDAVGADLLPYNPSAQMLRVFDAFTGKDTFGEIQDQSRRWLDDSRLDPATHGSVSQVLYGVTSQLPALAATAVNPAFGALTAGSTNFESSTSDLLASGVDPHTAHLAAAGDAAFAAIGALLPGAFGTSRALNTLAVGPAINLAQDVASRYATASLLEANGYDELAAQYRHLDTATLVADVVLGAGFGYLGARAKQHEVDAALVQQRIREQMLSGPGAPVDAQSLAKHVAALDKATQDLMSGRPVDVTGVDGAAFLHDPQQALAAVLERNGYHEEAAQIREIESQLAERGVRLPDEEELPAVPRASQPDQPPGEPAPEPKVQAAAAETTGAKPEALAPHEQAAVDTAQAIARDHSAQGEGAGERATVATPAGDVHPAAALAQAERQVQAAAKESTQFAVAVACAARHGA